MADWWQNSVIYALFPLSFSDSDGDGFGDINGVIERLDYLNWLGVDALWLGPIFPSPMIDAGYDISDFCGIDPRFGTMADFDRLVAQLHARGMKLILDFVPNHTSDQHPWFLESRSSRTNPRRDWYIWHDAKPDGSPPTNWIDNNKQCAWTWDEHTGQYYYRLFLPQQPDLNLRNPDVRKALEDVLCCWLDRGVDGFRLDAAMNLVEDEYLRDEPLEDDVAGGPPGWMDHLFTADRPETHEVIAAFRNILDRYPDKLFIGEVIAPLARMMRFCSKNGFHLPFNNQLMKTRPWSARMIDAAIDQYMNLLPDGANPNWVLGSHDVPRTASSLGPEQARVAALLLLTLPGTAFLFYGDEIGMENAIVAPGDVRDPCHQFGLGRDPYRAPMAWDRTANAGFSRARPWLPLSPGWEINNVTAQAADHTSILYLYRSLIALRRSRAALQSGSYRPCHAEGDLLAFRRCCDVENLLVVANLGSRQEEYDLEGQGRIILSTGLDREDHVKGKLTLRPNEGVVVQLGPR